MRCACYKILMLIVMAVYSNQAIGSERLLHSSANNWHVYKDLNSATACYVEKSFSDGRKILSGVADQTLNWWFALETTKLPIQIPNGPRVFELSFDSKPPWQINALATNDESSGRFRAFTKVTDVEFHEEFRTRWSMTLSYKGVAVAGYDLTGSANSIDRLLECSIEVSPSR